MEELPLDLFSYSTPTSLDDYPKTKLDKNIRRNKNVPTQNIRTTVHPL
jgi:hypothetical protein